jgi:DNA-binding MarR family transcriptional regulator
MAAARSDRARSQPDDVAAWRALLLAHHRVVRAIEADLGAAGVIPLSWYDVLLEVRAEPGGIRMQELGERAVLSRTRVSRIVDELEAAGLVARHADPDDGRATRAVITAAGERSFRDAAPIYLARIKERFTRHLLGLEQRTITAALQRVVAANSDRSDRGQRRAAEQNVSMKAR